MVRSCQVTVLFKTFYALTYSCSDVFVGLRSFKTATDDGGRDLQRGQRQRRLTVSVYIYIIIYLYTDTVYYMDLYGALAILICFDSSQHLGSYSLQ